KTAVKEIKIRAVEATSGVPSETRQVFPDGTNDFERILPGPNRMYPDTDTPPTPISQKTLEDIKRKMPEPLWECEKRLQSLGLPPSLVSSLCISENLKVFNTVVSTLNVKPTLVAVTLEETFKSLKRKGKNPTSLSGEVLHQVFTLLSENKISKEGLPSILAFLIDNPNKTVQDALIELQIEPLSLKEVSRIVDEVLVKCSNPTIADCTFQRVMGEVMKIARNRIDGRIVSDVVKTKLMSH
ncbi:MAG: hypothetical protein JW840_08565, partial [Candidatus Thermoplasmatota archaeon]|nr:hypothetical protein [Candidatus Thermoplasmatota archaeon]